MSIVHICKLYIAPLLILFVYVQTKVFDRHFEVSFKFINMLIDNKFNAKCKIEMIAKINSALALALHCRLTGQAITNLTSVKMKEKKLFFQ